MDDEGDNDDDHGDDDPENRIANMILLEEIIANLSSDEDGSTDDHTVVRKKRPGKQNEDNIEEAKNQVNPESESDSEESKKPRYRHWLSQKL